MRNFPTHFWQLLQDHKDEHALWIVDEKGGVSTETYWEWTRRVQRIAVSFLEEGLEPGERVGLIAENSMHWLDVAFGVWLAGGVVVPISTRADRSTALKCLGRSGCTWIVVEDADEYHRIRGQGANLPEGLHWLLIDWDGETAPGEATTLTQFDDKGRSLVARGRVDDLGEQIYDIDESAPAAIFYEDPPGEDPHGAFYSGAKLARLLDYLGNSLPFGDEPRPAVLTPLANPRSLLVAVASLLEGDGLGIGDQSGVLDDCMDALKPTHLVCGADYITRKTRRWRRRIEEAPEFLRDSDEGEGEGGEAAESGGFRLTGLLDKVGEQAAERLFYRPLRETFGGDLQSLLVLGDMLPDQVEEVLESSDTAVLDVYGHPECGVSHLEQPGSRARGAVGRPIQGYRCRVFSEDSSPENSDGDEPDRGEILIKSDVLFDDYWDGEGPREIVEGWLRTGDEGRIVDGVLYLT